MRGSGHGWVGVRFQTRPRETIHTPDVLARIQRGDPSWEQMVPAAVAEIIKVESLFGWRPSREMSTRFSQE
jgi:hypothetical protein